MNIPPARYYYFNDRIVDAHAPLLQLQDLGLFRGYAVFDFLRTQGGKPLLMERYLQRFRHSAEAMRLTLHLPDATLAELIRELIRKNGFAESGVRLLLSGGYSPDLFTPAEPNLIIRIEPYTPAPQSSYTQGARLVTDEYLREWPAVKHTNYINAIRNQPRVLAAGATEVLYHWQGQLSECSRSNLFIAKGGTLITPPLQQVLAGVTRGQVLRLARAAGIPVEERPLKLEELWQADEAFITATTKRVMPIVQIDHHTIGAGTPGPLSRHLLELWEREVEGKM
ncbi:aminotransferase class IV [Cesiribacter andamanensis]|uniref:aminotransferase class IV n=1 Tax=Cesiribacter andamanensis TaxID=649507 RepID=UPI000346B7A0|nr:aminotransferase class IV [Cesiribacter andamanensis]